MIGGRIPTYRSTWTPEYDAWHVRAEDLFQQVEWHDRIISRLTDANNLIRDAGGADAHLNASIGMWTHQRDLAQAKYEAHKITRPTTTFIGEKP